jgi:[1-hydroxy-2-(trimethylamino)ethyl]phosphonate dioxygenase
MERCRIRKFSLHAGIWDNARMSVYREILGLFAARGACSYFGETVSTTQHALQAAFFAQQAQASEALVLAALLHDIGHLVDAAPNDLAEWTTDDRHEEVGGRWLAQRFGPEVSEPVRLHVPAKRYLCATDAGYFSKLSPASLVTLRLQGGPMTAAEAARFAVQPFRLEAVCVRRWDDAGKVAGLATPGLEDYASLIEKLVGQK